MSDPLVAVCEAMLFVAAEPLALGELAAAAEVDESAVEQALEGLERSLAERGAGVVLDRSGGRYGLRAAPGGPAEAASRLQARAPERGLSPAAMETLAVVAYLQPVGRPEIARIRGVSSDAVVAGLLERELIEEAGRGDGLGAPVLYRTTTVFDRIFGLEEGVSGLPGLDAEDEIDGDELRQRLHAVAAERG
ncbi:MAG TPA: SMC-Scp complex subunit ScpB [Gaiellales bacterium]